MKLYHYDFQEKIVLREELIHKYVEALENADMEAAAEAIEASIHDLELAKIIEEIHIAYG